MITAIENDIVATREEVEAEIDELGRLSPETEMLMYNMLLKQEEPVPRKNDVFRDDVMGNPLYQPLFDRGFIVIDTKQKWKTDKVIRLFVTSKGDTYIKIFDDELVARRAAIHWDV